MFYMYVKRQSLHLNSKSSCFSVLLCFTRCVWMAAFNDIGEHSDWTYNSICVCRSHIYVHSNRGYCTLFDMSRFVLIAHENKFVELNNEIKFNIAGWQDN